MPSLLGTELTDSEMQYMHQVMQELVAARCKFVLWPTDAQDALAVVHEELGELQKDVLQMKYEPNKGKTLEHVRIEAVQTAAMALRFLFSLNKYTFTPGAQHTG